VLPAGYLAAVDGEAEFLQLADQAPGLMLLIVAGGEIVGAGLGDDDLHAPTLQPGNLSLQPGRLLVAPGDRAPISRSSSVIVSSHRALESRKQPQIHGIGVLTAENEQSCEPMPHQLLGSGQAC
jgi:hypothetical protein